MKQHQRSEISTNNCFLCEQTFNHFGNRIKTANSYIVLGAMGSPADLTLGTQVSSITSATKSSLPIAGDQLERMQKQEEYLRALEDERGKIEAFKRELPYCMQLLDDG